MDATSAGGLETPEASSGASSGVKYALQRMLIGSMVARLKLKEIDGRAPPGVEPAA